MMRRKALVGGLAVFIAVVAGSFTFWFGLIPGTDPAKIRWARSQIAQQMRDPGSAKFASDRVSGEAVCGTVNAKNAYGAYVGFTPYVAIRGGVVSIQPEDVEISRLYELAEAEAYRAAWVPPARAQAYQQVEGWCAFMSATAEHCYASEAAIAAVKTRCEIYRKALALSDPRPR